MNYQKKKYIFFYLKTGGGHIAPARSVANYLAKYKNEETETLLIDGLEKSKKFARAIVEGGYRILQSKTKWIFTIIYAVHKFKPVAYLSAWLVTINVIKLSESVILKEKPDKIVVFHFFLINPVYKVLKKHGLNIPVITVVTDPFTPHPLWFLRKNQNLIVFSEQLKNRCIQNGMNGNLINVFPFILDEKFSIPPSAEEVAEYKKRLGFPDGKVLLIMGGGDGIPNGISILKSLLNNNAGYEIAIVCGRNRKMFEQAVQLKEKHNYSKLKIFGFIDFVYELLCVSDVVITKCGASTFMEILLSKKVPVINTYIWEQEKGNVDFIVENELGIFEKRIKRLPQIIYRLFSEESTLLKYKSNIEKAGLQNGTAQVAEFLAS